MLLLFARAPVSQLQGHLKTEEHPDLVVHECTRAHGCIPQTKSVVLDANWRWIHGVIQAMLDLAGAGFRLWFKLKNRAGSGFEAAGLLLCMYF